jgi:Domain of unknown function (DUF3846)
MIDVSPLFYSLPAGAIEVGMSTTDRQEIVSVDPVIDEGVVLFDVYTPYPDDPQIDEGSWSHPECRVRTAEERVDLAVFADTKLDGSTYNGAVIAEMNAHFNPQGRELMKVLLIPADLALAITTLELRADGGLLEQIQDAVGGWVEALPWPDRDDVTCYLNEEGKVQNLPRNMRATRILRRVIGDGDWIAGNLLVTGFNQDTGDTLAIPDDVQDWVAQQLKVEPLRDPDRTVRQLASRHIQFEWLVKTDADDLDEDSERRHYAVLTCGHQQAGVNHFTGERHGNRFVATLGRETASDCGDAVAMRSFALGSGIRLVTQDGGRYSAKQFDAFATLALERLRALHDTGDDRVLRYFDPEAKD